MIANRRCCRPGELGLSHASHIISTVQGYHMMTLTDREINLVDLVANNTFYMLDLVLCCRYPHAGDVSRLESLGLQTDPPGVLCFLRRSRSRVWLAHIHQQVCRCEFSDGKHARPSLSLHIPSAWPSSGALYHLPLLDGLTPCRACRDSFIRVLPSNGSLDII
jgi:hypothetical protein